MNIAQALLDALKIRGAREVLGLPGDFALPFFKVLERAATTRGRFQLVEAMIPVGVYSNTLDRFVAGIQQTRQPAARS